MIEEGFGPVITVETFSTEAEAIETANHTEYGLAGAVWTSDAGTANRVSRRLRHGTVWINDYHPYLPQAGGAASSPPAWVASSAPPAWRSTPRPSTSTRTPSPP